MHEDGVGVGVGKPKRYLQQTEIFLYVEMLQWIEPWEYAILFNLHYLDTTSAVAWTDLKKNTLNIYIWVLNTYLVASIETRLVRLYSFTDTLMTSGVSVEGSPLRSFIIILEGFK